jgi:4a-hydroxytetrahydrobiopterin dehydratase
VTKTYSQTEIEEKLADHPNWSLADDGRLHAHFTFKNFSRAMLFAGAVGHLAEAADHHPDLLIHDYKNVKISLTTHSAGGITEADFNLIEQIEALPSQS